MLGTLFALLYTAHLAVDYLLQTDQQATEKSEHTRAGWTANLLHATEHVIASIVVLIIGTARLHLHLHPVLLVVAVAWIGASHAIIDRRSGIAWWMDHTGSAAFRQNGGAAHADQAAHVIALLIAALILA